MKRETRLLGVDDSPFSRKDKECLVVGVVTRGKSYPDAVLSTKVSVDGSDATNKLIKMINKSVHHEQIRVVMLDGVCLAGFNIVDIKKLSKSIEKPVVVVARNHPHIDKMREVMAKKGWKKKITILNSLSNPEKINIKKGTIYYQYIGLTKDKCEEVIRESVNVGFLPECIRLAHIIGAGIVKGESRGRA